jgi:DNA polymerase III epsilon subunit-like protein
VFILKIIIWIEALIASLIPCRLVVVDTETTGKYPGTNELLQVSIISGHGRVLFNHLKLPTRKAAAKPHEIWRNAHEIVSGNS